MAYCFSWRLYAVFEDSGCIATWKNYESQRNFEHRSPNNNGSSSHFDEHRKRRLWQSFSFQTRESQAAMILAAFDEYDPQELDEFPICSNYTPNQTYVICLQVFSMK